MNTRIYSLPAHSGTWSHTLSLLAAHARTALRGLARYLRAARERAARRSAMHEMNDAMLRDLGMHRSEIDSHWAESEGLAEATRLRLLYGEWR